MSQLRKLVSSQMAIVVAIAISSIITNSHVRAEITDNLTVNSNLEALPPLDPNNPTDTDDSMGQITNVSQLQDVAPGDWAFEALRNLVERYGCIAGYPDSTFRGNRALTRYEFAAGLNACLDQIQQLIATSTSELVTKEDLGSLQKLQEEFAAELATLRGRVDALEARTSELEANQFSTTTKLNGFVWFNLTGATAGDTVLAEGTQALGFSQAGPSALRDPATGFTQPLVRQVTRDPNITFSTLTWLNLNTSFSGRDALVTTLAAGNGNSPVNEFGSAGTFNNFAVPFTDQTPRPERGSTELIISELYYRFPLNDSLQLAVGPAVNYYNFFDFNRFTLFFNGASSYQSIEHPLIANVKRGAGAIASWKINDQFKLNLAYLAQSTEFLPSFLRTASDPSKGLFGGTNSSIAELTFSPNQNANIRFIYGYSNIMPNPVGQVQPLWSLHGVADDGPGGAPQGGLGYSQVHAFGVSFDWLLNPKFGIFGRYNYAITQINPNSGVPDDEITAQAFQLGAAFPDLGKRGAMGTVSFVVPFDVTSGRQYLVSGAGNGGTQYNIEATYFYPLTRNIAIVPAFYAIMNPNNFDSNPAIFVGNLRTQINF
ncbi:carbohydrate porin [Tolypothrix sp. FACHB-123]|uniref:iron uptake porin n=1 Tax=Tolypothrix sp. FACHB-123 TaxID=2692868 RepID=UPI001684D4E8|nr:iron uptake porin [Tolypothrix sp. FACHB-123]MBD2357584.1 carbohydrate porin [Tolypothrix sp. FACHB-123]